MPAFIKETAIICDWLPKTRKALSNSDIINHMETNEEKQLKLDKRYIRMAGIWAENSYCMTLQTAHPAESIAGEEFRPQVGDPPYRVVIDAGHGGADPGARGVVEEKNMTAATAAELIRLLQQDANFIPLQTRNSFDETATPAQRAARTSEQSPQLLLSIHGNSAANGSTASGFECYPSVPGRTWHQESFYFAQLLAEGMQASGAALRGHGGVRYCRMAAVEPCPSYRSALRASEETAAPPFFRYDGGRAAGA